MRNLWIIPLSLFLFLSFSDNLFSQDTSSKDYYLGKAHWGVGLQAGLLSGTGVSVRWHPKARFGFEINGGAFKGGDHLLASFGGEAHYDFDWSERNRFYGFAGFGYYQNGKDDPDMLKSPLRIGVGVGYDWDISKTVIFSVELGLTYFSEGQFLPLPQVGISYLFD
jgi:hypothetical protein